LPGTARAWATARVYYDRLLNQVRPDAPLIALAYECQMFPELAVGPQDISMDKVVTEKAVYEGRGRMPR